MRYYILAVMALVAIGCSDSGTDPSGKPYQFVIYYAPPGCGAVYVKGGTANPYVRMEPGQTVTVGFDKGYSTYPGGIIDNKVTWEKVGDNTVNGSFSEHSFLDSETWRDTIRCSP